MFDHLSQGRWWDRAWTLVDGCTPVSPGCEHCWSASLSHRFQGDKFTRVADAQFRGFIQTHPERLDLPLKVKKPTAWAVWNDLFHEDVPYDFLCMAWSAMVVAKKHIFIILTKRPERMKDFVTGWINHMRAGSKKPIENIWLGVTAENQEMADLRIPILLQIPAAVRFVSVEPMLGPVDFCDSLWSGRGDLVIDIDRSHLDWVIYGGESGPGARPMHPDWARSLRDQCQTADVPFFFKQWGEWVTELGEGIKYRAGCAWGTLDREGNWFPLTTPWNGRQGEDSPEGEYIMWRIGKKAAGRLLDGRTWDEIPLGKIKP